MSSEYSKFSAASEPNYLVKVGERVIKARKISSDATKRS
jgi:hypothetical protein